MISVIYCTRERNPEHTEHLRNTSGLKKDIDIIEIINTGISLTKCYNHGLKQAKYDIVVFCHDDIIMTKNNWGRMLLNHFNDTDYGILGMAGTTNLHESGRWWTDNTKMVGVVKHSSGGKTWENKYSSNFGKEVIETVIVDGLFFAVHKDRVKVDFDEGVEGFHFYEIDYCFRNRLQGVKIGVMFDIKITHKSVGETNKEWDKNRETFIEKYSDSLPMNIEPEVRYSHKDIKLTKTPKVTVIIPTKGKLDLLFTCINSLYSKDDYSNLEVIIADTGSSEDEIQHIKDFLKTNVDKDIKLVEYDYYNFAKINNDVVKNHVTEDTELLLFCNNDIELLNNAITQMVGTYLKNKKNTGTIGCRLHYGDNTVQHSGVIMVVTNQQGNIGLSHKGLRSYHNYHLTNANVFGNTAAFMLTPKSIFDKIGGFNERYLECFEDVEYNIECLKRNCKNTVVGEAVAYHYESQTRNDDMGGKGERQNKDLSNRLIPKILTSQQTWDYFENIKRKDYERLLKSKHNA